MERLGYVPLSKALQKCDGRTGYRVRTELDRYLTLTLDEIYSIAVVDEIKFCG